MSDQEPPSTTTGQILEGTDIGFSAAKAYADTAGIKFVSVSGIPLGGMGILASFENSLESAAQSGNYIAVAAGYISGEAETFIGTAGLASLGLTGLPLIAAGAAAGVAGYYVGQAVEEGFQYFGANQSRVIQDIDASVDNVILYSANAISTWYNDLSQTSQKVYTFMTELSAAIQSAVVSAGVTGFLDTDASSTSFVNQQSSTCQNYVAQAPTDNSQVAGTFDPIADTISQTDSSNGTNYWSETTNEIPPDSRNTGSVTTIYTDGIGDTTSKNIENADNSSSITLYDQAGLPITTNYSGPNGTGQVTSTIAEVPGSPATAGSDYWGAGTDVLFNDGVYSFTINSGPIRLVYGAGLNSNAGPNGYTFQWSGFDTITTYLASGQPADVLHYGDPAVEVSSGTSVTLSYQGLTWIDQAGEAVSWGNPDPAQTVSVTVDGGPWTIGIPEYAAGAVELDFSDESGTTPCYLAGTKILTGRGYIPVEALLVGELVKTVTSRWMPIKWIGHRLVDIRRHPRPWDVSPVRVTANAFGVGQPSSDLLLSPDHSVYVEGVLIPVRYLVNGRTVVQEINDNASYWHVELDSHNVIFAEGLPCETYLDTGNRAAFANGGAAVHLHPNFAPRAWETKSCAPLVLDGPRLIAARCHLLDQARALGSYTTTDPHIRLIADGDELPLRTDGCHWSVRLPSGGKSFQLRSLTWIPAHMQPDQSDTRSLGIAISRLWLDRREVGLDSPGLRSGWHAPEQDWRWTNGNAELALGGARELTFEVAIVGTYWLTRTDDYSNIALLGSADKPEQRGFLRRGAV